MSYLKDLLGNAYKEGMTEEEISSALEGIVNAKETETTKLKTALSKSNSEAAEYKKQLKARMSDQEKAEAEQKALYEKLAEENKTLKREKSLSDMTARHLAMGYDKELATASAIAFVDGDMETYLSNQQKHLEAQSKKILSEQMKNTPHPAGGSSTGEIDYSKKIEEAMASGNISEAAYYMRASQEAIGGK